MRISSPAFEDGAPIPRRFTCEGTDQSPPLHLHDVPTGTKSLVLIVDDPDAPDPAAPKRTWVHWVVFNLPPATDQLTEGAETLPKGAQVGTNDWKRQDYGGPCPPVGRHRYFHKLYALDTTLSLTRPTKQQVETAMQSHVIAKAQLVGTYKKGQP